MSDEYARLLMRWPSSKRQPFPALFFDRNHLIEKHLQLLNAKKVHATGEETMTTVDFMSVPLDKEHMITIEHVQLPGLNFSHMEKFLLCRSILPSLKIDWCGSPGMALVVDDPDGQRCLRVFLYHCTETIPAGTVLAIMWPSVMYYPRMQMGAAFRVDFPSQVHQFKGDEPLLREIIWRVPLPEESGLAKESKPDDEYEDLALEGNRYFNEKNYERAVEAYSKVIEEYPNFPDLYSNQTLAYLKLGRPSLALRDSETGLKLDPSHIKLQHHKAKALVQLKRYEEAAHFLVETCRQYEAVMKQKGFADLVTNVDRMVDEFKNGNYDILKMIDEAKRSKLLENHADYYATAKIEVKKIDGKGRGVVAKEKIEPGTLLMACKAFVFVQASEGGDPVAMNEACDDDTYLRLFPKVLSKLQTDDAEEFFKLYAGKSLSSLVKFDPHKSFGKGTERIIHGIMRHNVYFVDDYLGLNQDLSEESNNDYGVWITPSYINHSCVDCNCFRFVIGDFMFVRATKVINPGEELLLEYIRPSEFYTTRLEILYNRFGFECTCRLCQADRNDPHLDRYQDIRLRADQILKRISAEGNHKERDMTILKNLLAEALQYRQDKGINFTAAHVQQVQMMATDPMSPAFDKQLVKNMFETRKSAGDLYAAFALAKLLAHIPCNAKKAVDKWKRTSKELSRIIFGDKRVGELLKGAVGF